VKNIHLKLFLPLAIGLLVLLPALLITWIGYRAAQQTAIDAANAVMVQASLRASDAADADLAEPARILNFFSSYDGGMAGMPDPQHFTSMDRFEEVAWGAMRGTRLVKFLGFASMRDGYRAINVYDDDALPEVLLQEKDGDLRQRFRSAYPLDRRMSLGFETRPYVASSRPWFTSALAAADKTGQAKDARAWTDVYHSFSRNELQVGHSTVVRNAKREIIGVLALDVSFKLLSTSLHSLEISPNAIAFIVDNRGDLVATSVETMLLGSPDVPRVSALQANSPLIRHAMRFLPERVKLSARVPSKNVPIDANNPCKLTGVCESYQFDLDGQTYLAHALVLNQSGSATSTLLAQHQREDLNFPDWRLVIAVPAEDFNFVIRQKGQRTLGLAIVLALIASAFGIWFASRLNGSIAAIARAADKLGHGNLEPEAIRTNFVEFKQISDELGNTAKALEQSRKALLAQNAELEKRVHERTSDLEHQTEQALQAAQAKAAFLATMSHEIRTPMNGVIGMTDLLSGTSLSAAQRDYVETIRSSGNALLTIINDILDFSKIESGKMTLECEPFSLQQMIEDCIALLASVANQKKLELLYEFDPDVPKFILGDVTRVRQIVLNLLSNAVKFTERGEVIVQVSAASQGATESPIANLWEIHVRDSGIGIPADRIDHLFSAFTQIDAATTRKYGGTGLGLAISRRLAELMGGGVRVHSDEGTGSVFTAQIQAVPYFDEATVNPNTSDMAAREQLKSMAGKKVLLIDQNENSARIMCQRLAQFAMVVQIVQRTEQLLGFFTDTEIDLDLVVINLEQSPFSISDLSHRIKQSERLSKLPLLALLASTEQYESDQREIEQLGHTYLLKPVRESHLTEALLQLLFVSKHGKQLAQEAELERRQGLPNLGNRFPLRMLIVDDNPTNRKVAGMMLERLGYQAKTATDGRDAVDQILAADANAQGFDVVWMDLHMPVLDGLESTKIVRNSSIQQPQIIAVTAAAMHGDKEICLQSGMNDYVSKPLESAELQAALERFLISRGFEIRRKSEAELSHVQDENSQQSYFDPNRFMAFCEGNPAYRSTFIGLIQNMLKRGPEQFDTGLVAWKEQRIEDAARVFHTMRGSMGTLGATAFVEASRQIESAIIAKQQDEVERLFVQVEEILDITLDQARAWLNQQEET